jgi:hypothetical protein
MATSTRKSSGQRATAQKRAAEKAEEVAKLLHSFAQSLKSPEVSTSDGGQPRATARNWWRAQAGRFKDDPTFGEFVARAQAARRQEG